MNRIQYLVDDEAELFWSAAPTTSGPAAAPSDGEAPHCLFTPQHYERNYAYPLLVWLHGPGDDERQVTRVMPLVSLRNYVAVGPRGTSGAHDAGGFSWLQQSDHIALAEERVDAAVAAARRWLNVAPERIYVAGYACGGTMALRVALNRPERFAGALSIDGPLPANLRPFARLQAARKLHLLLAAGRQSRTYPEQEVCGNLRLLHAAGISLHLRLYPCADEVTEDMLGDMDRWIMEHVAGDFPAAVEQPRHSSWRR
jgi:phospholipase/carboxylesterase